MRIAVVGVGGVGGYFGGRLAEAGESVVFVARGAHRDAIRSQGLRVESVAGDFVVRPAQTAERTDEVGPVDLVVVGVKAWQVTEIAPSLRPLIGADTVVLPLQNGVEAPDQLAAILGSGPVVGGLCRIVSYRVSPGVIRHAGVAPSVALGEMDGRTSARVERIRAAFARCRGVAVDVPLDIRRALWEKLLFIAPFSAVSAATRAPAGGFRAVPESRRLLETAMREVVAVAKTRGVALADDAVARTVSYVDTLPAEATPSMQRDILEGRPSELENQTGAVVRLAAEAGLRVPANEFLYATLLPAERAARART